MKVVALILVASLLGWSVYAQETQSTGSNDEWQMDEWGDWEEQEQQSVLPVTGFFDVAVGQRFSSDPAISGNKTLRDLRVQVQWEKLFDASSLHFTSDLYYDGVKDNVEIQVRELAWQGRLSALDSWGDNLDVKVGQQVLTWGTGDYLFLNDLFPKDWQSFFSGRDDEYLKAPSLSAKVSGYFDWGNVDVVVTPRFAPDNYINGEVFSFFNPMAQSNVAPEFVVSDDNRPEGAEVALRYYRSVDTTDIALYGYRGYHKSPNATDEFGRPRFTRLNVYGASAISPFGSGLAKVEYAFHDSMDDSDGSNPLVPNSQSRFLVGYEHELVANLTGSVQWYLEHNHDHSSLLNASPWPQYESEQNRHVVTTQLMYRALRQTLTLNWFNFYSPTDSDGYMRFRATYKPVDEWSVSGGLNWFYGDESHTFFNQFEDASNAYMAFRYYY
ncbi:hypothetical protein [Aestuariibacter salexigens]|uniref:hypothetical protein n=1 Tax=Aestuariibacter salexigens TaxID=226010 RepID=UPI0004170E41|nr:hypothetical protein [Aestuariibacter salexigens]